MELKPFPVALPPGLYNNGNRQDAAGRWHDGNLMRWVEGKLRAVGGWSRRLDVDEAEIDALIASPATAAPRGIFGWRDNAGGRLMAVGTTTELFIVDSTGTITDITPVSFTAGLRDSGLLDGYGVGSYGTQTYGTPREGIGLLPDPVGSWRFDAWGENLLAAGPLGPDTELYEWVPGSVTPAAVVTNAPTDFADFLVTDLRQVMVVGTGAAGMGIAWSDRENNTTWTPAITNQAGSVTVKGTGRLVSINKIGTDYLVLGGGTSGEAYRGTYTGPLYGYGFVSIEKQCGALNAASVVSAAGAIIWPSKDQFFIYNGGVVKPFSCDIIDYFLEDRNKQEESKIFGFVNSGFNEIWWLYQSTESDDDCDKYISFNYRDGFWSYGKILRSVALDAVVTSSVQMLSSSGEIYNHEQSNNAIIDVDNQPRIRSGPISIGVGGQIAHVDYVLPADDPGGGVLLNLYARNSGNSPERVKGPYTIRHPATPVKVHGREIDIELVGDGTNASWKLSTFKLNMFPDGDR